MNVYIYIEINGYLQRVAKVVPRLVGIVENSFGALDFEKSCLFVKRIGNA